MDESSVDAEKSNSEAVGAEAVNTEPAQAQQEQQTQQEPQAETSLLESAQDEPEQTEEDKPKAEPEKEATKAPEQYEAFKAPEGIQLDAEVMKQFSDVAKELNLPQEAAQGVIDRLAPVVAKQQVEQVNATNRQWQEKVKNDPDIGGANLKSSLTVAARALKPFKGSDGKFADEDIAELTAIAGNHPGLIKILKYYGNATAEDRSPSAKAAGGKRIYTPEDFYNRS